MINRLSVQMKPEEKKDLIFLSAIILFFGVLRFPTLYEPFGRDQGIFATIASGLLNGKIPYRDLWDHKPPGIYFLYALIFKIFGKKMWSVSLFEGLYTIFNIFLIFKITMLMFGRRSAYLASIIFTLLESGIFFGGWWGRGQPEVFMLLPLLGLIYLLLPFENKERSFFSTFTAGILGGIALSFKTIILPLIILCSFYLLFEKGIRRGIFRVFFFNVGVLIALFPFLLFFWRHEALYEFLYSSVIFNLKVHTNHPYNLGLLVKFITNFVLIGKKIHFIWLTLIIFNFFAFFHLFRIKREKRNLLLVWISGIFLSIVMGWWLFPYHFILLIPPLAIFTSFGFFQLFEAFSFQSSKGFRVLRNLALSFLSIFISLDFFSAYSYSYLDTGIISALLDRKNINIEDIYSKYRVHEYPITDFSIKEDYLLSQYLKERTREDEKIFIWGWESLIYFLSGREPASRYIFIYPLIQDHSDRGWNHWVIFWKELKREQPRYFIVVRKDQNPIDKIGSEDRFFSFPELSKFLKLRYRKEKETERFLIYRKIV